MHPTTITTSTQGAAAIRSAHLTATALAALDAAGEAFEEARSHLAGEIHALLEDPDEGKRFAMVEYLAYNLAATTRDQHGADAAQRLIRDGYFIALNAHRHDGREFTSVTDLLRLNHQAATE